MAQTNIYIVKRKRFLKDFDLYASRMRPVFESRFGMGLAGDMISAARQEYEILLPGLPDVGGKQPFLQFTLATGMFLAMVRVTTKQGIPLEETGQVFYDGCRQLLQTLPGVIQRFVGRSYFTKRHLERIRNASQASHERLLPDGYVFDFVEGDGKSFNYGVDYLECASVKYLKGQDAAEIAPYLCPIDILYSDAFGWGLKRTKTLADGDERCDFRFRKGACTDVLVKVKLSIR